jgi:hypothetical protein
MMSQADGFVALGLMRVKPAGAGERNAAPRDCIPCGFVMLRKKIIQPSTAWRFPPDELRLVMTTDR